MIRQFICINVSLSNNIGYFDEFGKRDIMQNFSFWDTFSHYLFWIDKLVYYFLFSPFTYSMVKRETNAVVGTLEVEDYFENGITYCRIDTQGVVARYKQRNWIILRIIFFLDISEQQSHPNLQLIQVKFITIL